MTARLARVILSVQAVDRLAAFYRDAFGLKIMSAMAAGVEQ